MIIILILRFISKSEYLTLAENLSEYTVKLLGYVSGRDELETFLNKTGKENEEKFDLLARLDLAIKYREMPVCCNQFVFFKIRKQF